jgi:hypothetical protein
MKPHFLLVTILIAAALLPGAAIAQQNATTGDFVNEVGDTCAEPEAIDAYTVLCESELDGDTAELVLRSDRDQRITLTDAGGVMAGGEVNRQRFTLREDEANTVRFRVTTSQGFAGVTIDTGPVLYAVPLETSTTLIGPPWSESDVQLGAIAAGLSTAIVSGVVVLRAIYGRTDDPERIA